MMQINLVLNNIWLKRGLVGDWGLALNVIQQMMKITLSLVPDHISPTGPKDQLFLWWLKANLVHLWFGFGFKLYLWWLKENLVWFYLFVCLLAECWCWCLFELCTYIWFWTIFLMFIFELCIFMVGGRMFSSELYFWWMFGLAAFWTLFLAGERLFSF